MTWIGIPDDFKPDKKNHDGFIYLISHQSGENYIGKKSFWSTRTNKKTNKKETKESDWKRYQSSNQIVQSWSESEITKTALSITKTKFETTYREIEALIKTDAIRRDDFLNYMLGSSHIGRCPEYLKIKK